MGKIIDGNIIAKDTTDNATPLSEIAKQADGNILICRFSNRMCRECVVHAISVFTDNKARHIVGGVFGKSADATL